MSEVVVRRLGAKEVLILLQRLDHKIQSNAILALEEGIVLVELRTLLAQVLDFPAAGLVELVVEDQQHKLSELLESLVLEAGTDVEGQPHHPLVPVQLQLFQLAQNYVGAIYTLLVCSCQHYLVGDICQSSPRVLEPRRVNQCNRPIVTGKGNRSEVRSNRLWRPAGFQQPMLLLDLPIDDKVDIAVAILLLGMRIAEQTLDEGGLANPRVAYHEHRMVQGGRQLWQLAALLQLEDVEGEQEVKDAPEFEVADWAVQHHYQLLVGSSFGFDEFFQLTIPSIGLLLDGGLDLGQLHFLPLRQHSMHNTQ